MEWLSGWIEELILQTNPKHLYEMNRLKEINYFNSTHLRIPFELYLPNDPSPNIPSIRVINS